MILAVITLIVALFVGSAIGSAIPGSSDGAAALAESEAWVTVTEMDGVRLDMPLQPRRSTAPIPGSDLTVDTYYVDFGDVAMAAVATEIPVDTRSDAAVLREAANGGAASIGGTIAFSRRTAVDGEPARDFEVSTPREGGGTMLGRAALADDLLVIVQTVFLDEDDRDVAVDAHNRMSRSIRFEG